MSAQRTKRTGFGSRLYEKGKGYAPAEKNPDYFHGISSFDEKTGIESKPHAETWSDFFGTYLCAMASENKKITAVTAAMPLGTGLTEFASKYPDRFFDVAIAEQHEHSVRQWQRAVLRPLPPYIPRSFRGRMTRFFTMCRL